jgi:hypothetical protein
VVVAAGVDSVAGGDAGFEHATATAATSVRIAIDLVDMSLTPVTRKQM